MSGALRAMWIGAAFVGVWFQRFTLVFDADERSYAKREAVAGAQQKRALAVLTGGKLAS